MKVLGISAGRVAGNSEILLKTALKAVENEGHEVSFLRLHDYEIKPCIGCEMCTWLGRSGQPIHCKYKRDEDDFYSLMQEVDQCQGLILAAPAYHLLPPGLLGVLVNRLHGFGYSASQANKRAGDPKLRRPVATIGVAGSDWNSLQVPVLNFYATELICSQMNLVDQLFITGTPALGNVAIKPDALERAALLGKRVASQLGDSGPVEYLGDRPEACPICHSDVLILKNGRLSCAICDVAGDPEIDENGKIRKIKWDGGIEVSRFSMFGGKKHDEAMGDAVKKNQKRGYVFTDEDKKIIKEMREKVNAYLTPIKPTRISEEGKKEE